MEDIKNFGIIYYQYHFLILRLSVCNMGELEMDGTDIGLERMCKVYLDLSYEEKEKVIKLAEGLLKSQNIIDEEKSKIKEIKIESNL